MHLICISILFDISIILGVQSTNQIVYYKLLGTYSKGVSLLPRYGRPPGVEPHLVWQRLRHSQQDEADVGQSYHCGHQNHQVVPITGRQVSPNSRTCHQACCKSS